MPEKVSLTDGMKVPKHKVVLLIALLLAIFHLYTASFGILPGYMQSSIHWALITTLLFIIRPLKGFFGPWLDGALIVITWYITYYLITVQNELVERAGAFTLWEVTLGVLAIFVSLEAGRRSVGFILPLLNILFIFYALFGQSFPGFLQTANFPIDRIAPYLYTSSDGLFGQVLYVSAQFIFLYILFGAVLNLTGAGTFFVDLAYSVAGKIAGGPAQAAVVSSMLMGSINGSGAANVVTTGTFTIPLMKKVGYKPEMAGAIEAVASNGGQIMPPVMGAVAFLMAEITGIPYVEIMFAALVPALLYYLTLSSCVYLSAKKSGMAGMRQEELPNFGETLRKGWIYLIPLILLVVVLVLGYSPQKAAFYAILVTFAIGWLKDRKQMTIPNILHSFREAAEGIIPIASACVLAGGMMGIIQLTGLGIKISGIIEQLSQGNLLLALLYTMIVSLILGMGLPTSAAYLILAVLVAPALVKMGATLLSAHLFILYFGALSTITPPVALSVFAAAGIAGSKVWNTGIQAVKLASAGFIIPFIFAFSEELLLKGSPGNITIAVITGALGCLVLSVSLTGWIGTKLNGLSRILLFAGAILLIIPQPVYLSLVGFLLVAIVLALNVVIGREDSFFKG